MYFRSLYIYADEKQPVSVYTAFMPYETAGRKCKKKARSFGYFAKSLIFSAAKWPQETVCPVLKCFGG